MKSGRPWFDLVRGALGYRFPRTGPLFFRLFYAAIGKRYTVELFPGIFVDMNFEDLTHKATYWQGSRFEYPTAQILRGWGADPRCRVFFDIGANYGFFSYLMLSRFPGHVHAFDPNPVNHAVLLATGARNNLLNLHPHRLGLSDRSGVLPLHLGVEDQGHSTFLVNPSLGNTPVSVCEVARFDDWISGQNGLDADSSSPDWIAKIDVEGYELNVLRGMERSLRAKKFLGLAVELNPYMLSLSGTGPKEVCGFLSRCGYAPYRGTRFGGAKALRRSPNGFFVPEGEEKAL